MTNSESGKVTVEEQVERLQAEIGKCCSHGGQKISGKVWMTEKRLDINIKVLHFFSPLSAEFVMGPLFAFVF